MKLISSRKALAIIGSLLIFGATSCASYKTCPTYAKAEKPAKIAQVEQKNS